MYDLDLLDELETVDAASECGEADPHERLMTAALLTATAFRLKDSDGLVMALRDLVAAVSAVSTDRNAG